MQSRARYRSVMLLAIMGVLFTGCSGRFDDFPSRPGGDSGGKLDMAAPPPEASAPDLPLTPPSSWLLRAGGSGDASLAVWNITVDKAGNTYISGDYSYGPVTLGKTTLSGKLPPVEHNRIRKLFVAKISPMGKFLWARNIKENDNTVSGTSLDSAGNLYLFGAYEDSPTLGPSKLGNSHNRNAFVAKMNPAGSFLWAVAPTLPSTQYTGTSAGGFALDSSGNIYITGSCQLKATFGATTVNCTKEFSAKKRAGYMAMLDSAGKWKWAKTFGGDGLENWGVGVGADSAGGVYFAGSFEPKATFGSQTLTGTGGGDLFVTRMDKTGKHAWAVAGGGSLPDALNGAMTLDDKGNTYYTDTLTAAATFGGTTVAPDGSYGSNAYVTQVSASGKFTWALHLPGVSPHDIANDGAGNIYITGSLSQPATLGPIKLSPNGADVVVIKMSAAGKVLGAMISGVKGGGRGWGVDCDGAGNIYISGQFWGTMTQGSTTISHVGKQDAFIWKIPAGTI